MTTSRLLIELVIIFGAATIAAVIFQAVKLPIVLAYVLAGLLVGPHVPIPLVANASLVHVLSELGVILLMFTIGLELPLRTIAKLGLAGALTALFEVGLVVTVGSLVARLVGFDSTTAIFVGACLGISSTMLVAKAFDELGWKGGFTDVVFSILVFEDLIAIVLLATVTAVAGGAGLDLGALGMLLARLAGFLAIMLVGGLVIVPRAMRWIAAHTRRETLAIAALAVCVGTSALAATAGYSVALGAFVAGVLIAESGHGHAVTETVEGFRDVFAMVFFVSVGMTIDPAALATEAPRILLFSVVVLVFKPLGVASGTFLAGHGLGSAIRAGLSLAQIGEFSFVIAGALGNESLLAIAVGVSCVTTLVSPLFIRNSETIAARAAHGLPGRLATFVSFYDSWLGRMRTRKTSSLRRHRRSMFLLGFDAAMVIAVVILGSSQFVADLGMHEAVRIGIVIAIVLPFAIDIMRRTAILARRLANDALPTDTGGSTSLDLGRAGRRALVLVFELAIAMAITVPIVAILQPFVPGSFGILAVIALGLIVVMRKRLADFDGHVRASSEVILEFLSQPAENTTLASVSMILPGFEGTATVMLDATSAAVGSTLAQLDLRARTGATVLAIARASHGFATPSPNEPLAVGDRLAMTGSEDAITLARTVLVGNSGTATGT